MKHIKFHITILVLLFSFNIAQSKDLSVADLFEVPEDLTAKMSPVLDNNDQACALIKVVIPDKAAFEGNVVRSEYKTNEYFIYVTPGTKQLVIKYPGAETLTVNFTNYLNSDSQKGLRGARTYRLKLDGVPAEETTFTATSSQGLDYQNNGIFTLNVEPTNAEVLINGLPQNLDRSGKLQLNLPWGNHSYRINANKYYSADGQFKLDKKNSKVEKKVSLKPKFGYLTITSSPETDGAEVKVDGVYFGTIPVNHSPIDNGPHSVTISKKLYLPFTQNIQVSEGNTTTINPSFQSNYAEYEINTGGDNTVKIVIDNEYVGNGTWKGKLEAGTHIIEAQKENYKTSNKTVKVKKNTPDKIVFSSLIPEYGTLNIFSNPKDAIVAIDGKNVSSKNIQLKSGTYHVTLSKRDYYSEEFEVTIYPNQVLNINKKLSKRPAYSHLQWINSKHNKSCFTIYAAYENLHNPDLSWDGNKYNISKNNSGAALGVSYDLFSNGFVFTPAFEIAYDADRIICHYRDDYYYYGDSYTEDEYDIQTWNWLNFRLPLQIGYRFVFSPMFSLQVQTGPVAECYIGARTGGKDMEFSNIYRIWDYDSNSYVENDVHISENLRSCLTYKRFNIDWRLGLTFNIKKFLIGVTYNKGLTNRVGGYTDNFGNNSFGYLGYYEFDTKKTAKQTRNYIQIKLGVIL